MSCNRCARSAPPTSCSAWATSCRTSPSHPPRRADGRRLGRPLVRALAVHRPADRPHLGRPRQPPRAARSRPRSATRPRRPLSPPTCAVPTTGPSPPSPPAAHRASRCRRSRADPQRRRIRAWSVRSSRRCVRRSTTGRRRLIEPAPPGSGGWIRRLWPFLAARRRDVFLAFGASVARHGPQRPHAARHEGGGRRRGGRRRRGRSRRGSSRSAGHRGDRLHRARTCAATSADGSRSTCSTTCATRSSSGCSGSTSPATTACAPASSSRGRAPTSACSRASSRSSRSRPATSSRSIVSIVVMVGALAHPHRASRSSPSPPC